jgi:hypothetical protein
MQTFHFYGLYNLLVTLAGLQENQYIVVRDLYSFALTMQGIDLLEKPIVVESLALFLHQML